MDRNYPKWLVCIFLILISLSAAHHAFAGGAYISQVATPGSLGTAGVVNVVNNKSADSAWTNPAGMTGLENDEVLGGLQIVLPSTRFDSDIATAGGSDGGNAGNTGVIPGLFAVKVLSERWRLGFAATAPFGGGLDYGDDFVGRYHAQKSILTGLGLSTSVGYKIHDNVSLGAGVTVGYTVFDYELALRQPGPADGQVHFDKIDDWGAQGFFGLTWQVTDRAMLGFVYRTKIDLELEGDIKFKNITVPILNQLTSRFDEAEISFDFPEVYQIGLQYQATEKLILLFDADYEKWSDFSTNRITIDTAGPVAVVQELDRDWDDTWHIGAAVVYEVGEGSLIATGLTYDSSVVDDDKRTADLPLDEQVKFGLTYAKEGTGKLDYSLGLTYIWMGDGKMDQVAQGERYKGEFSTNFVVFAGGTLRYQF